jgi:hypothetical protein
MMSRAFTKKVHTKGRIMVRKGQCVAMANIKAAVEIRNNIQYKNFAEELIQ